jgi:hypothetical protein
MHHIVARLRGPADRLMRLANNLELLLNTPLSLGSGPPMISTPPQLQATSTSAYWRCGVRGS